MKICISGDIIEEIISEAHEREGVHHPLQQTWHLVLTTPYWWPTRRRDVWEYCQECPICLDRNEGRIKEEEPEEEQGPTQELGRKIKFKGERKYFQTQEPKQHKDWKALYVQYLTNGTRTEIGTSNKELRKMAYWSRTFFMEEGRLRKVMPNGEVKICINEEEVRTLVKRLHDYQGRHLSTDLTWQLVLIGPYWWPTIYNDVYFVCDIICHTCK